MSIEEDNSGANDDPEENNRRDENNLNNDETEINNEAETKTETGNQVELIDLQSTEVQNMIADQERAEEQNQPSDNTTDLETEQT